jgi:hypothetical protein
MGLLERWFSFAYLFFCCCLFVGLFMIPDAFIAIHVFMFFFTCFCVLGGGGRANLGCLPVSESSFFGDSRG